MQVEEESPKQYVDIARAPDKEMPPEQALVACASSTCPRALSNGNGPLLSAPSHSGCGQDGRLHRCPA